MNIAKNNNSKYQTVTFFVAVFVFYEKLFPAFRTRYFLVWLWRAKGSPQPKLKNELKQMLQSGLGLPSFFQDLSLQAKRSNLKYQF
ncbi:hypothetical protein [Chryseobacterium wanjuense]